jgi:hypothetical protein
MPAASRNDQAFNAGGKPQRLGFGVVAADDRRTPCRNLADACHSQSPRPSGQIFFWALPDPLRRLSGRATTRRNKLLAVLP